MDRIQNTGYFCLPDFVRKDVHLWFAIDNIDFLENIVYGQNTLLSTLVILFQRNEDGEIPNPLLKIPLKVPKDTIKFHMQYKDEPSIKLTTIRFTEFSHDFGCRDFNKY